MMKKRKSPSICLASVLKKKHISKYRFARLLGKETSNVAVYFRKGYSPNFKTLIAWSEALDCKISDFIDE